MTPDGALDVPIFRGSAFQLSTATTETMMTVLALVPGVNEGQMGAGVVPVASIALNHHGMKELALLLARQVEAVEKVHGTLRTPWLDEQK